MIRDEAYKILTTYLKNPNLVKHCLATEATMKALYKRLMPQPHDPVMEETWGITGLLHDADYEIAKGHPELHGLLLFQKEPNKIPEEIAYAIKSHNYQNTKVMPQNIMDWSITCCDQLTGLIVAATLVHPQKKIIFLTPEFVLNRFNEKSFAKGADREVIKLCETKLNIPLLEFITITLIAMQSISNNLGL